MKVGSWRWYSSVEDLEQIDSHPDCELTGEAYQWFSNLPVIEMPNIGRSLAGKIFQAFNAKTCGELMLKVSHSQITNLLGKKTGNRIYLTCHGKDFDSMRFEKEYKSVSASMNYGIRLKTQSELEALVCSLCEELSSRMANVNIGTNNFGCLGKSLTIRLYLRLPTAPEQSAKFMGHGLCSIKNHTIQMAEYTSEAAVFFRYAVKAVHRLCPEPQDLRGIGFHVHQLHGVSTKADILTNADVNGNCKPVKHSSQLPASHQPQCLQSSSDYSKVHRKWDTMDVRKSSTVEYDISGILRTMEKTNQAIEEQKADVSGDANEVMSTTSVKPKNNNSEVCKRSPTKRTCRGPPVVPVDKRSKTNHREFNCSDASRQKLAVAFENSTGHETSQVGCLTQALENPSGLFVNKTLSELQQIFADWITSEEVPMYEDIQILTDYLLSLVDTNLERIRSVLLLLDRLITKLAQISDSWRNAYIKMHNTLSQSIEEKYSGSSLKLRLA
ncbi:unnamed protein product [Heterobilharzia americana]|nr:unnamed protein product [Heterobilharzia americana]